MKLTAIVAAVLLAAPQGVYAQTVPDSIHSESSGPFEMCGFRATTVADLKAQVRASSQFERVELGGGRFELYATPEPIYQLAFTMESEKAYPAVTCRALIERDGRLSMDRSMRCDAGRAECDALFTEFHELDERVARQMREN